MKSKPFLTPKFNRIEIVNEAGILLVSDLVLVVCNPAIEGPTRKILGYILVGFSAAIIVGNLGIMVYDLLVVTLPESKIKAEKALRKLNVALWTNNYISEKKRMYGYAPDDWFYEKGLKDG